MLLSSSDYLIRGVLFGLVTECAMAALATIGAHTFNLTEDWRNIGVWLFAAVIGGSIILLWRPVSLLTISKKRQSPFLLEDDLRAVIAGRIVGTALGFGFGVTAAITLS